MVTGNRLRLVYVSVANDGLDTEQIYELLKESRTNNKRLNICGLLLYKDGEFLQVLEGERCAVDSIYDSIRKDLRHHDINLLVRQEDVDGMFSEWNMGFIDLNQDWLPGLDRILKHENFCTLKEHDARVKALIAAFAEGRWRRRIRGDSAVKKAEQTV